MASLSRIAGIYVLNGSVHLAANGYEFKPGKTMLDLKNAATAALKTSNGDKSEAQRNLEATLVEIVQPIDYLKAGAPVALPKYDSITKEILDARVAASGKCPREAHADLKKERDTKYQLDLIQYVDDATDVVQLKEVLKILIQRT